MSIIINDTVTDGANFLDNEIYNLETKLPEAVQSARICKTEVTRAGSHVILYINKARCASSSKNLSLSLSFQSMYVRLILLMFCWFKETQFHL